MLVKLGERRTHKFCWREGKAGTVEKSMDSLKKIKTRMPCVPAIPPPGLPSTSQRQVCVPGVLWHRSQQHKYGFHLNAHWWMATWVEKTWCACVFKSMHVWEYYSSIENNAILSSVAAHTSLEGTMVSQITQAQRYKYHVFSCQYENQNHWFWEAESLRGEEGFGEGRWHEDGGGHRGSTGSEEQLPMFCFTARWLTMRFQVTGRRWERTKLWAGYAVALIVSAYVCPPTETSHWTPYYLELWWRD